MTPLYKQHCKDSAALGENNRADCSVKAIAAVTGRTYEDSHKALAAAGRKPRAGANLPMMEKALHMMGHDISKPRVYSTVKSLPVEEAVSAELYNAELKIGKFHYVMRRNGLTHRNVVNYLDKNKKYLVQTKKHVFAVVDGIAHDFYKNRKFRVEVITEVL